MTDNVPGTRQAPQGVLQRLRHLGPGLIITASIVGSGELIMTTKLGAEAGFTLLWLVILGCIVKVFVQVELGRYALTHNQTTLEALDKIPGPRLIVSWLVWLWFLMFLSLSVQVSGIVGALAGVLQKPFPETPFIEPKYFWLILVTASVVILLAWGRYRLIETLSTLMVFLFTIGTIIAVVLLAWTEYSIGWGDVGYGLSFNLSDPEGKPIDFTTAFAAFGITGVGASELIYYPYWCLEKGYADYVGPKDDSPEWQERAKGWIEILKLDAFLSMIVYTVATAAFYMLGAAVLHRQGLEVDNAGLVPSLSTMYETSFGAAGMGLFVVGAFFVLYSTYFVASASNAQLLADALKMFRIVHYPDRAARRKVIRFAAIGLPIVASVIFWQFENPVSLVMVGAVVQACLLPLLGLAAIYLSRKSHRALSPGPLWYGGLLVSTLAMALIGLYNLYQKVKPLFD